MDWCDVSSDAGILLDCSGERGADPDHKAFVKIFVFPRPDRMFNLTSVFCLSVPSLSKVSRIRPLLFDSALKLVAAGEQDPKILKLRQGQQVTPSLRKNHLSFSSAKYHG